MSRTTLILLRALGVLCIGTATGWCGIEDPHLDPSVVTAGCSACHSGHGVSGSPMLPEPQVDVCLSCHGSSAGFQQQAMRDALSSSARPSLLSRALSQPFSHPLTSRAFSQHEPGAVTCTSCHSPHRGMRGSRSGAGPPGRPLASPKDPSRFEYELCESCHGNAGSKTQSLLDISRLLNPMNRSYHPVEAPSAESSPSVIPSLAGQQINCTECHGNDDPTGPRGPHGSSVRFILRGAHPTVDGSNESLSTYMLCYSCHERQNVLNSSAFPHHARHIVEERSACATCHNAHGSVNNRALIRFGEETFVAGVSPSASTGRLAFVSEGPGSGMCFLSCHGYDHAPEAYGTMELLIDGSGDLTLGTPGLIKGGFDARSPSDPRNPLPRRKDRKKPRKN